MTSSKCILSILNPDSKDIAEYYKKVPLTPDAERFVVSFEMLREPQLIQPSF